jgi:DNA-3-methyladenine glycosylase II
VTELDDRVAERAAAHAHLLGSDRAMARLAERQGPIDPYQRVHHVPVHDGDLFEGLAFHIVGQSISEAGAVAVFDRLRKLVGDPVTSVGLASVSVDELHGTGLSAGKARTLAGLAATVVSGELDLHELAVACDDEVAARLTALSGIGPWTASIFILYELRRPDAMPAHEVGIRKAVGLLDGLVEPPKADAIIQRAEGWRPYRSYAAGHLWRSLKGSPDPSASS